MNGTVLTDRVYSIIEESLPSDALYGDFENIGYYNKQDMDNGFVIGDSSVSEPYLILDTTGYDCVTQQKDASTQESTRIKDISIGFMIYQTPDNDTKPVQTAVLHDDDPNVIIRIKWTLIYKIGNAKKQGKTPRCTYLTPGTVLVFGQPSIPHWNDTEWAYKTDTAASVMANYIYTPQTTFPTSLPESSETIVVVIPDVSWGDADSSINDSLYITTGIEGIFSGGPLVSKWGRKGSDIQESIVYQRNPSSAVFDTSVIDVSISVKSQWYDTDSSIGDIKTVLAKCNLEYGTGTKIVFNPDLRFNDSSSYTTEYTAKTELEIAYDSSSSSVADVSVIYTHQMWNTQGENPSVPFSIQTSSLKRGDIYNAYLIMPGQSFIFTKDTDLGTTSTSVKKYRNELPSIYTPDPTTGELKGFVPTGSVIKAWKEYRYDDMVFDLDSGTVLIK